MTLPFALVHGQLLGIAILIAGSAVLFGAGWLGYRVVRRRPLRPASRPFVAIGWLVVCTLVCAGIEGAMHAGYERACDAQLLVASRDAPVIRDLDTCALAAVSIDDDDMELRRRLRLWLRLSDYRDQATVQQIFALNDSIDGCGGIELELAHERYEAAEAKARRCHDDRALRTALALQGKLREAAAISGAPTGNAALAIAAGQWREAAALTAGQPVNVQGRAAALQVHYNECLAALFLHYAGDADAAGKLRALADAPDGEVCAPVVHEIADPAERARIDAALDRDPLPDAAPVLPSLAWLDGAIDDDPDGAGLHRPELALAEPEGEGDDALPPRQLWLAAVARPPSPMSASMYAWKAVFAALEGDLAAANASAATAHQLADRAPQRSAMTGTYDLLPALIALRTPSTTIALPPARTGSDQRVPFDPRERAPVQLRLGALPPPAYPTDTAFMAILPRLTTDRAAAIRQLVWRESGHPPRLNWLAFPSDLALHAAARRDALRLADQPAEAARFDAIYRRLAAVLTDRRTTVALLLYQR